MSTDHTTDELINKAEEAILYGQFRRAVRRLEATLGEVVKEDPSLNLARGVIERIHLVAGDRRMKEVRVQLGRRHGDE